MSGCNFHRIPSVHFPGFIQRFDLHQVNWDEGTLVIIFIWTKLHLSNIDRREPRHDGLGDDPERKRNQAGTNQSDHSGR